jgi:hypothetical protein
MSSKIKKSSKTSVTKKTEQRNSLLELILRHPVEMPNSCSFCEKKDLICSVSADSSRCAECVRNNQSMCDAQNLSTQQLRRIATQHSKMEAELEKAEEERDLLDARVKRLRKQKKLWFEKMTKAISRGLDSVEELERVEREEAEREEERQRSLDPPPRSPDRLDATFEAEWNSLYGHVPLSPSLMAEMGFASPRMVDPGSGGGSLAAK